MSHIFEIIRKSQEFKQQIKNRNPYFLSLETKLSNICIEILKFLTHLKIEQGKTEHHVIEKLLNLPIKISFFLKKVSLHLKVILALQNQFKFSKFNIELPQELEDAQLASMSCFTVSKSSFNQFTLVNKKGKFTS